MFSRLILITSIPAFFAVPTYAQAPTPTHRKGDPGLAADRPDLRIPAMLVTGPMGELIEERAADGTGRPNWTSHRRFGTTRVYIQKAPWEIGFEQWWRVRDKRDDTVEHKFQEEIEIGLPYRMQLDIYLDWFADGDSRARYNDTAFELRYALADWGKIPLNPALYAEYKVVDPANGPDVYEFKLLLGEQLAPRFHWGLNAVFENEMGGERTREWQVSQGVSFTVIDEVFSVGLEMKWTHETTEFSRGEPEQGFLLGPSIQWCPTRNSHVDLVSLWGTNRDAPNLEAYVIFGIDLGKIGAGEHRYAPVSVRSN